MSKSVVEAKAAILEVFQELKHEDRKHVLQSLRDYADNDLAADLNETSKRLEYLRNLQNLAAC